MQIEFEILKTFCKQYIKNRCRSNFNPLHNTNDNCKEVACPIGKLQFKKEKI